MKNISALFFIENLYGKGDFSFQIKRSIYEELCMDLWKKCFKDKILNLSKLKKKDINEIILVGGSTRTPKIQEMVKKYLNGKELLK